MKIKTMKNITRILLFGILLNGLNAEAQRIEFPWTTQKATVTQRSGISDVTISYSSPSVNKREIWGKVVPFGSIWRAGAAGNTTIHFTHNAKVNGKDIDAGTYGLYMLPEKNTVKILFSKFYESWGTRKPNDNELILTVETKFIETSFQEWLTYDFIDRGSESITAALEWGNKSIPFKIEFDHKKIILDNTRSKLRGSAGFDQNNYLNAAFYCLKNDYNLKEALEWIEVSVSTWKQFTNLKVKSELLMKLGKEEEAKKSIQEALEIGKPYELNRYGYTLLGDGKIKDAITVFKTNIDRNPKNKNLWSYYDSLGEAYLKDGNKNEALKNYKIAKKNAPTNQQNYLDGLISKIE